MYKKIIAIGPLFNAKSTFTSGQSMMFQLFIDELLKRNIEFHVIDINGMFSSDKNRKTGTFSLIRLLDYFIIILRALFVLGFNSRQTLYLTTAQSRVGFIRDYVFINVASILSYRIITHQFGGNYTNFYEKQSLFFKKVLKNTLDKTNNIVVEGDFTKRQFCFLKDYESKVIVIPNGLPEKHLKISEHGKKYDENKTFQMLYLSNLIVSKGYMDVLQAVDILVNKFYLDVNCIFAGKFISVQDDLINISPEKRKELFFKYITDNNLTKQVQYTSGLFGEEKAKAFQKAHVFLLPSYYINEGQPVSVVEAIAYGVIPIVTNYRLIPSMVNENSGYFVSPKCPEEIADTIKYLIKNPQEYEFSSQASYKLFNDCFTSEKYTTTLLNLIDLK